MMLANTPSDDDVRAVIADIEAIDFELRKEKMDYARRCKPIHEQRKSAIDEAVAIKGFNRKALTTSLKERSLLRRAQALTEDVDDIVTRALERMRTALGDLASLPLGKAALDRGHDALVDLAHARAERFAPPPSE